MKSIFTKIFVSYVIIICVISILLSVISLPIIRKHYIDTLAEELQNIVFSLEPTIRPIVLSRQYSNLDRFAKQTGRVINTRITVISPDGVVLADSEKSPSEMDNHHDRPEILSAMKKGIGRSLRYSRTLKEYMLYVAIPIESGGSIIGVLRGSLAVWRINKLLNQLGLKLLEMLVLVIFFAIILASVLSRTFSKPIRQLAVAAHDVARGKLGTKIFLKRHDELGKLSEMFNYMTSQIEKLFGNLSLKQMELNTIISSIHEGIIVIDKNRNIILCNKSFVDLFKIADSEDLSGKAYWNVISHHRFNEIVERCFRDRSGFQGILEFVDKILYIKASFLFDKEELIIGVQDITEFKMLEKVKKDFVTNVSHELRTPLTAIKGYAETLSEMLRDEEKKHIDVITKHTDRLINIVEDLLTLFELEENAVRCSFSSVGIKGIINNVLKIFNPKIKAKGLKLLTDIPQEDIIFKADAFKIEQLLINLIDNAIKYTEQGTISVFVCSEDDSLIIKVSDTGIGIPKSEIPRIFERFYVVDKSRSRKLGGTGLGMSIVKHIVMLHSGEIEIVSQVEKGTTVIVKFPLSV